MTASRRPWLVPVWSVEPWLSVKPVRTVISWETLAGTAHGVPVCLIW